MPHAGDLIGYAVVLVVATLIISFGAYILDSVLAQQTPSSVAANVTTAGLTGLNTFGTFLPIVAIVLVAGVLIGILISVFAGIGAQKSTV
jgi:hypothetical protein